MCGVLTVRAVPGVSPTEFVRLYQARKATGLGVETIMAQAIIGKVRVAIEAGRVPFYHLQDCQALAESRRAQCAGTDQK